MLELRRFINGEELNLVWPYLAVTPELQVEGERNVGACQPASIARTMVSSLFSEKLCFQEIGQRMID